MSGFEIFGLACNVMTVITFTRDTITLCKAVYQGDMPDAQLSETALSLKTASAEIQSHCTSTSEQSAPEKRLIQIATRCHDAAAKLEDEVGFITSKMKDRSKTAALRVAFETTWRRRRLQRLENTINACRNELESSLLARVWYDLFDI